jgi:hypothetical protein
MIGAEAKILKLRLKVIRRSKLEKSQYFLPECKNWGYEAHTLHTELLILPALCFW